MKWWKGLRKYIKKTQGGPKPSSVVSAIYQINEYHFIFISFSMRQHKKRRTKSPKFQQGVVQKESFEN